jgi:DNA-binding transcriptional LysR family regulator
MHFYSLLNRRNMLRFDWNLVNSFIAVASTGSLSAAARQLGSSQPTVGRHVAELERDLGIVLFRRGLGGYDLTEKGAELFTKAQIIGENMDRFALQATGAEEGLTGSIRISASEAMAAFVLPQMLARFATEEPGIEVELVASNQVDNLLRRDADIAIRMVTPLQEELIARKIGDVPLSACASKSYLDRRGVPSKPEDLLSHDLIGEDRGDNYIKGFAGLGYRVDRHAFHFRTDNQIVMFQAICAGLGVGFAQLPLIKQNQELQPLLLQLSLPLLPVWLTMHKDVKTSPRIRRTADFLYEELSAYVRSAEATRPASRATITKSKASAT